MTVQKPENSVNTLQLYVGLLNDQYLIGTGLTASVAQPDGTDSELALLIGPLTSELAKNEIGRLSENEINADFSDTPQFAKLTYHVAYEMAVTGRLLDGVVLHPAVRKELFRQKEFYQYRYNTNLTLFQAKQRYIMPLIDKLTQLLEGSHLSVFMTGFNPKDVNKPDFPSLIISGFSRQDLAVAFGCISPRNRNKKYDSIDNIAEAELDWEIDCTGAADNLKTADELVESIVSALNLDRIHLQAKIARTMT